MLHRGQAVLMLVCDFFSFLLTCVSLTTACKVVEITPQLNEIINFMTKELGDPRAIDAEALSKTARVLDVSQVSIAVSAHPLRSRMDSCHS